MRIETSGENLGQKGWFTTEEPKPPLLEPRLNSSALELGAVFGDMRCSLRKKWGAVW